MTLRVCVVGVSKIGIHVFSAHMKLRTEMLRHFHTYLQGKLQPHGHLVRFKH